MKKFFSIITIITIAISLVKFGEWVGQGRGYSEGWTDRKKAEVILKPKREIKLVIDKSALNNCIKEHDMLVDDANSQIQKLKYEAVACEDRLINYEYMDDIKKNLHPEEVEELEPYQVDY